MQSPTSELEQTSVAGTPGYNGYARALALGELLPGVAHNFGNILMSVSAVLELVSMRAASDEELADLTQVIDGAMNRVTSGADIIQRLMLLAGDVPPMSTDVDLSTIAKHALSLCSTHRLAKQVTLIDKFEDTEVHALADPVQIEEIVVNLLMNALQASDHGEIHLGPTYRQDINMVGIYIRDEGCGINQTDMDRIFDPLFSKRHDGTLGTGLGLACSLAQIKQMGGSIQVHSEHGRGSTFTVLLPAWTAS